MADDGDHEVQYLYRTDKAIRGREAKTIAEWQSKGWELHAQDPGTLRTTLTFRKVVTPSRFKPWMAIAGLFAVGVLGLGSVAIADAFGGGGDSSAASNPTKEASATPSDTPSATPSDTPSSTPTKAPVVGILTVKTNPDLKTLLKSDEDYALSRAFAKKYAGRTIRFDGSIANVIGSLYLVYAGDNSDTDYVPGPSFQFHGLQGNGGHRPGDNLQFVAKVGGFNVNSGLFALTSVSTNPR